MFQKINQLLSCLTNVFYKLQMTLTMNFTPVIVNHFSTVLIAILNGTFAKNSSSHVKMEPLARLLIAHM